MQLYMVMNSKDVFNVLMDWERFTVCYLVVADKTLRSLSGDTFWSWKKHSLALLQFSKAHFKFQNFLSSMIQNLSGHWIIIAENALWCVPHRRWCWALSLPSPWRSPTSTRGRDAVALMWSHEQPGQHILTCIYLLTQRKCLQNTRSCAYLPFFNIPSL